MASAIIPVPDLTPAEIRRFTAKLKRDPASGCLLWTGGLHGAGYGRVRVRNRKYLAHRVAFVLGGGVFTEDKPHACHRCDNPACCEYGHLFAGDDDDNHKDMARKGRGLKSPKGLPFGAHARDGRFQARCQINGHLRSLGNFATAEEASAVALAAKAAALGS